MGYEIRAVRSAHYYISIHRWSLHVCRDANVGVVDVDERRRDDGWLCFFNWHDDAIPRAIPRNVPFREPLCAYSFYYCANDWHSNLWLLRQLTDSSNYKLHLRRL